MADSNLERTRVDQLGLTDSIQGEDKFIVSQQVENDENGNVQNATNIASFATVCGHVAESDPVVNKMLEIHYQPPHDGYTGSVKEGFGISIQQDGTVDNDLYLNNNLIFGGDNLNAGLLYDKDTQEYYKPCNLDLPLGMFYTRSVGKDGPNSTPSTGTGITDDRNCLGFTEDYYSYVDEGSKLGVFPGETIPGTSPGTARTDDTADPTSQNYDKVVTPVAEVTVQHLIEWTRRGLGINSWYNSNFSGVNPFETISLCRVANLANNQATIIDNEHKYITVTIKTLSNDTSAEPQFVKYFQCTLGPGDTEAVLTGVGEDSNLKLGKIVIFNADVWRTKDVDRIYRKKTGALEIDSGSNKERYLCWEIGISRSGVPIPSGSEDIFTNYSTFVNGTAKVVAMKAEYGTKSTGFYDEMFGFTSKESSLNQAIDKAICNTVRRELNNFQKTRESSIQTGVFPSMLFEKNKPAHTTLGKRDSGEKDNAWQRSEDNVAMRINVNETAGHAAVYENVADAIYDSYTTSGLATDSEDQDYSFPIQVSYDGTVGDGSDLCFTTGTSGIFENGLDMLRSGSSKQVDLKIAERLKIANQIFSGNITVNGDQFRLEERRTKVSTGYWSVHLDHIESGMWPRPTDPEYGTVPQRSRIFKKYFKVSCSEDALPAFSKVRDVLVLNPATYRTLPRFPSPMQIPYDGICGGVYIANKGGLVIDEEGSVSLDLGEGLAIDNSTGKVYVSGGGGGGATIDDTTTAADKTWSSNKINTELGKKQATLNAGSNITLTPQQDGTVTIASSGGGGGASNLNDLGDVDLNSQVSDDSVLVYSRIAGKWQDKTSLNLMGLIVNSAPMYSDEVARKQEIDEVTAYVDYNFLKCKTISGTLAAGNTSLTLTDSAIKTSSIVEVFDDLNVPYDSISTSNGSMTITFEAQSISMNVKVRVS